LWSRKLNKACGLGNRDSQNVIEKLAPHTAAALKEAEEWEQPKVGLEKSDKETLSLIESEEAFALFQPGCNIFSRFIKAELGPASPQFNLDPPLPLRSLI